MKVLESRRLILRLWKISDLDDLHELTSNKEVASTNDKLYYFLNKVDFELIN